MAVHLHCIIHNARSFCSAVKGAPSCRHYTYTSRRHVQLLFHGREGEQGRVVRPLSRVVIVQGQLRRSYRRRPAVRRQLGQHCSSTHHGTNNYTASRPPCRRSSNRGGTAPSLRDLPSTSGGWATMSRRKEELREEAVRGAPFEAEAKMSERLVDLNFAEEYRKWRRDTSSTRQHAHEDQHHDEPKKS